MTVNDIVWSSYFSALTDSVFYEDTDYLRALREFLLSKDSKKLHTWIIRDDFRPFFTPDETEWYAQLLSLVAFVEGIAYQHIYQVTHADWEQRTQCPEYAQAQAFDEEYLSRTEHINALVAGIPVPKNLGEIKIYHLVLREVTSWMIGLRVGWPAVHYGYPIAVYAGQMSYHTGINSECANGSGIISRAKRMVEALAGEGDIYLSCRLGKASTGDSEMLVISFS